MKEEESNSDKLLCANKTWFIVSQKRKKEW